MSAATTEQISATMAGSPNQATRTSPPQLASMGFQKAPRPSVWAPIKEKLDGWAKDRSQPHDPDFEPPSPAAIHMAFEIAERFRESGFAAPQRLAPDAEGGLSFERSDGRYFSLIRIAPNGSALWTIFLDQKVIEQIRFTQPA